MSKLDDRKKENGRIAAESVGVGVYRGPIPGNQVALRCQLLRARSGGPGLKRSLHDS